MTFSITIICRFSEYRNAKCRDLFIVMVNAIMLSVIMVSVIMLNVVMLSGVAPLSEPFVLGAATRHSA
jgi:hypothetical protein